MKTFVFLIFFHIAVNSNNFIRSYSNENNVRKYNVNGQKKTNSQFTVNSIETKNNNEPVEGGNINYNNNDKGNTRNKFSGDLFTVSRIADDSSNLRKKLKKEEITKYNENNMEYKQDKKTINNSGYNQKEKQEGEQENEQDQDIDIDIDQEEEQKDDENENNDLEQEDLNEYQENQGNKDEKEEDKEQGEIEDQDQEETNQREKEQVNKKQEEIGGKEREKKEIERNEIERKEIEKKEMERKEREKKEMERKEREKKEMERKEREKKEMERKEREKKEMERKEREKKEREKREIRREMKEIREKRKERSFNANLEIFKNNKYMNNMNSIAMDEGNKNIDTSVKTGSKLCCNKIKNVHEEKDKNTPNNNLRTIENHDNSENTNEKKDEISSKEENTNNMMIDNDLLYEERKQKILLIHLLKNIKDLLDRQRENFYNFLSFLSENYASYENLYSSKRKIDSKENIYNIKRMMVKKKNIATPSFLSIKDSLYPTKNMQTNFIKSDLNILNENGKGTSEKRKESDSLSQLRHELNKLMESNNITNKQKDDDILLIMNILDKEDYILNKEKLQYALNEKIVPIINEKSKELKDIAFKLTNEKEPQNERVDVAQNLVSNLLNISVELKNTGNIINNNIQGQGEILESIERSINGVQKDLQNAHISASHNANNQTNDNNNENKVSGLKQINEMKEYKNKCSDKEKGNNTSCTLNSVNCTRDNECSSDSTQTNNYYKKFKVDKSMKKYFLNIFIREAILLKRLYKMLYSLF